MMTEREIEVKKQVSKFFKTAEQRAKRDVCALCGKPCTSFANSHSVPQFVLKNIDVNGKFKTFGDILGRPNSRNGMNNAWTFHVLCSDCENLYFKNYENEEALLIEPTNKIMAEITLKNALLMLHKYRIDRESDKQAIKIGAFVGETDILSIMNDLDLQNIDFEIRRSKRIIDKNLKSGFNLIYYKKLDWIVPIAFQSEICMYDNIDGSIINPIYSEAKETRMQKLQVCIFPLSTQTVIMVFVHKDDRNYVSFQKQFGKLNDENKLQYINYLIFKYTEHMLISPSVDELVLINDKLVNLCEQRADNLFGNGQIFMPCEIPNFLSQEFALTKQEDSK